MLTDRGLWRCVHLHWRSAAVIALIVVGSTAAAVGAALCTGYALGRGLAGIGLEPRLLVAASGLVVAQVALSTARSVVAARLGERVVQQQRSRLVQHVLCVGPELRRSVPGSIPLAITEEARATAGYVTVYAPQLVATLLCSALLVAALAVVAPAVALTAGLGIVAVPVLQRLWSKRVGRGAAEFWDASSAYVSQVADALRALDTLHSLGAAERYGRRLRVSAEQVRGAATRGLLAAMGVYLLATGALGLATVGATLVLAWTLAGPASAIAAAVVLLGLPEVVRPWRSLQEAWHEGFAGVTAQRRLDLISAVDIPVVEPERPQPLAISAAPEIVLDRVSVCYGLGDDAILALDDVSLTLRAGSTTALVGRSGAGKSTLLAVLMRHRDPDEGRVLLNGTDFRDLAAADVRAQVGWVAQDITLFAGTVADNLRLARPSASDEELRRAAERARLLLHPREGGLAFGLSTPVGDRGRLLSGGQRQRVAIARVLLRDAPIVVLDEPTSALDLLTEAAVAAALAEVTRGRTVIVVSHRGEGLPPVDDVVILDAGRIVAHGPASDVGHRAWQAVTR